MKQLIITIICLFLVTSCSGKRLYVQNRYIDHEDLASYHIGTRDFRKKNPDIGQKLVITWSVPSHYLDMEDPHLLLKMRYRNREEREICLPLEKKSGNYTYTLLNEEYFEKDGILTYKAMIIGDHEVLEEWKHQIWADMLVLD